MTAPAYSSGWKGAIDSLRRHRTDLRLSFRRRGSSAIQGVAGIGDQRASGLRRRASGARQRRPYLYASTNFRASPSLDNVFEFCRVVREQPIATAIVPGERHWSIFETLCQNSKATGNIVQDAWFAALAIESGCEWITADRDYARFKGLSWRPPF